LRSDLRFQTLGLEVRVRVLVLHLVRFYESYCTLAMRYCHVTAGGWIRLQTWRSTGGPVATANYYIFNLCPIEYTTGAKWLRT